MVIYHFPPSRVSLKNKSKPPNKTMNTLENIISEAFDPSYKDMMKFRALLEENKELASLILGGKVNASSKNKTTSSSDAPKKPRAPIKPKADEVRCNAVTWYVEMNEDGELIPKRCSHEREGDGDFCKQHMKVVDKKCAECSAYHGSDIVHHQVFEHLGRFDSPNYMFKKFWDTLVKSYEKRMSVASAIPNESAAEEVKGKKASKKKDGEEPKKKREANGFIKWKQANQESLRAEVLAEKSDLKGKDLAIAITKKAGEKWKEMKEAGSLPAKEKAIEDDEEEEPIAAADDDDAAVHEDEAEDEEEPAKPARVFKDEHNVWVDEETDLFYESEDADKAMGFYMEGLMKPLKANKKK